jgi:hypothetical protein
MASLKVKKRLQDGLSSFPILANTQPEQYHNSSSLLLLVSFLFLLRNLPLLQRLQRILQPRLHPLRRLRRRNLTNPRPRINRLVLFGINLPSAPQPPLGQYITRHIPGEQIRRLAQG